MGCCGAKSSGSLPPATSCGCHGLNVSGPPKQSKPCVTIDCCGRTSTTLIPQGQPCNQCGTPGPDCGCTVPRNQCSRVAWFPTGVNRAVNPCDPIIWSF